MLYYLLESAIIALFINLAWRFVLYPITNICINFLQWVAIIWIVKMIFFDVFKLIADLSTLQQIPPVETNNIKQE